MEARQDSWSVGIVVHPRPELCPVGGLHQERRDILDAIWNTYIEPGPLDGVGDYEDFYEQAARLHAAVTVLGPARIWLERSDLPDAVHLGSKERCNRTKIAHLPRYGMQARIRHGQDEPADDYMADVTFRRHAGRATALAGFRPSTGTDLVDAVRDVIACSESSNTSESFGIPESFGVIVKGRRTKSGLWHLPVGPASTQDDIHQTLQDALGWDLVHAEGRPEMFLVQEQIPLEYEYRLFVVGQMVVAGAGCVEEYTPLDAGERFDIRVRRLRGSGPVEEKPDVVTELVGFGQEVVAEFTRERPQLRDYVLDVASSTSGPVVVERNALLNSGLYASQPETVLAALVEDRT